MFGFRCILKNLLFHLVSLRPKANLLDIVRQLSFGKMFLVLQSNPCQHPIVILRDVREEDLRLLLNFMYQGEVQVDQERITTFLRTAETLQIKGLTDHPLKDQCQKTSSVSVCSV